MSRKIGILTSGGDCAGLNAAIRAVVRRAMLGHGWEVWGIASATDGLQRRPVAAGRLELYDVDGQMARVAGSILGSNSHGVRGDMREAFQQMAEGYRMLGLDALIAVGGDGSFAFLRKLAQSAGINLVGIPKTIDNDIGLTENAIGYDTAVMVATEALDRLQPTAASHDRIMVLEVMGRDAGHIALAAGIAGMADVILIPEIGYDLKNVAAHIQKQRQAGKNFSLVIVSEAIRTMEGAKKRKAVADIGGQVGGSHTRYGGIGDYIAQELGMMTGGEARVTVLGHVQRGAAPTHLDRMIGAAFGVAAVDLVAAHQYDKMVTWQNRQVVPVEIADAIARYQAVDPNGTMVATARGLGICLGD